MGLIDSHCHLHYDYAPKTSADLVREALEEGLEALITVGTDLDTLGAVAQLSDLHSQVFHTVGVHPHETQALVSLDALEAVRRAATHPKCVAIGEIGLDYYYEHSSPEAQVPALERQLEIAHSLKLPVVIHSRDAEEALLRSLTQYARQGGGATIPGVIHCFTGTYEFGRACLDLGFYLSFSGILTFKKAEDLRACARAFPVDRLLVETDSPYLAPIPHRGKKCEPRMVRNTALELARIKGVTLDELIEITSQNTKRVFSGLTARPA